MSGLSLVAITESRGGDSGQICRNPAATNDTAPNGGFLLNLKADDQWAAVEEADELIESLAAMVTVARPGNTSFVAHTADQ